MTVEDLLWEALEESSCCGMVHSSEMSVSLFAETIRKGVLDEVHETLRLELIERNAEQETARYVVGHGGGHGETERYHRSMGRTSGVAKCMEIVEAMKERA